MSDTTTTTVAKANVKAAEEALKALGLVRDPKSDSARAVLRKVGSHIAAPAAIKKASQEVDDITGALEVATEYRDGLITYRNAAIIKAQAVGFSVTAIEKELKVSRGTVQNFADATKVRNALKAGGTTNPPSVQALYSKVSNLTGDEKRAMIEHAEKTGELIDPRAQRGEGKAATRPSVKSVLNRAESLSDALKVTDVKATDAESLKRLVEVANNILRHAQALTVPAVETPADDTQEPVAA